ncbi:ATP-binding protein [Streptomyces parvulus]|uniref:ATP-binding protein n=1 Tax=Streptomyces parvulus TaxID=146923 RepID=UPI003807D0F7
MRCARGGPGDGAATGAVPTELFGRREETTVLDGLLSQARGGSGGALVVWGEPGIGKSALLRHVHGQATDFVRLSHSATRARVGPGFRGAARAAATAGRSCRAAGDGPGRCCTYRARAER